MKKKVLNVILVMLLVVITLTGCGTRTKATDITIEDGDTIIIDEEDMEIIIDNEDEVSDREITEEEVVGDTDAERKTDGEATYTEHEFFFALDELDMNTEEEVDMNALKPNGNDFKLNDSVNLYGSGLAAIIGYTKPNISVHAVTSNEDWYCISFADEIPEFQYALVKAEDFLASTGTERKEENTVTYDDVLQAFVGFVSGLDVTYELVDTPSASMKYVDFSIPKNCENVEDWVGQMYIENNLSQYFTYCIEQQDKDYGDGYLNFRFYYAGLKEMP